MVNVSQSTSSVSKGETLIDTAKTLDAMAADCVVIRHFASGAPHTLAKLTKASIINAGDGAHEHPTQALLDAFTIRQRKGRLNDLRVAIIGDIAHSRVARSNLHLLTKFGTHVWLCSTPTLMPASVEKIICENGQFIHLTNSMEEAVHGADVIMMLRIQFERMNDSTASSDRVMSTGVPNTVVMLNNERIPPSVTSCNGTTTSAYSQNPAGAPELAPSGLG